MTRNDIDGGLFILSIAIAPEKPPEFAIFRIAYWQT